MDKKERLIEDDIAMLLFCHVPMNTLPQCYKDKLREYCEKYGVVKSFAIHM
jgi:hypothetical protein